MTHNFYYNTIYVIESLDDSEYHTGKKLYETIKNFEYKHLGVKTFLKLPKSKSELFEVLSLILDSVRNNNCLPIIHLEIHGNNDGVQCANSDFIFWEELYPYFIEINIKLKNTLIITTGICFGAHFYFNVDINKPAPFFTLISSITKIHNGIILESYEGFFNELINSENINSAINHLNLDFLRPSDNEKILELLILVLLSDYKKLLIELPGKVNFSIIQANKIINEDDKKQLFVIAYENQKRIFISTLKTIWFKYLMLDLYPDTKYRYVNIQEILLEKISEIDIRKDLKDDLTNEVLIQLS